MEALFIVALIALAIVGLVFIPRLMVKRAISQVIRTFRKQQATNASSARTIVELGLKPRTFVEGMMRPRDYKPYALDILRNNDIVLMTEDGRLYLSEEKLSSTGLEKRLKIA